MTGQTKQHSLIESVMNILIGFSINWSANMLILPLFGFHITPSKAFNIGLIFTIISLIRSYTLRRIFNKIMLRKEKQ